MNDSNGELSRRLAAWDPARRLGDPDARTVASMRHVVALAARRRRRLVPLLALATLTAAAVTLALILPAGPPPPAPAAAARPVTIEFTASNGIRIHWSVYPEPPTSTRRGTP